MFTPRGYPASPSLTGTTIQGTSSPSVGVKECSQENTTVGENSFSQHVFSPTPVPQPDEFDHMQMSAEFGQQFDGQEAQDQSNSLSFASLLDYNAYASTQPPKSLDDDHGLQHDVEALIHKKAGDANQQPWNKLFFNNSS